MSAARPEESGQGLAPEDVEFLFMEEPAERRKPAVPERDYKKAAAGDVEIEEPEIEEDAVAQDPGPPIFEEPWPSPPEGPDPDPDIDLDPGRDRRTIVQGLAKATTGRAMIDALAQAQPQAVRRAQLTLFPSDLEWPGEIKRIFKKGGG